jgi:hypothetical protein
VQKREKTLGYLAGEYRESLEYTAELKRAIDGFRGNIPPNSPYRYLRSEVGGAILTTLESKSPQTIPQLIKELQSGGCVFGAVKTPQEIVTKAVKALVAIGKVEWADQAKSQVRLSKSP